MITTDIKIIVISVTERKTIPDFLEATNKMNHLIDKIIDKNAFCNANNNLSSIKVLQLFLSKHFLLKP
jgi:hypothetical protein